MNLFYWNFHVIAIIPIPLSQITALYVYAKQYIYLEKLKDKNKCTSFNVDFLGYLSHLKHMY